MKNFRILMIYILLTTILFSKNSYGIDNNLAFYLSILPVELINYIASFLRFPDREAYTELQIRLETNRILPFKTPIGYVHCDDKNRVHLSTNKVLRWPFCYPLNKNSPHNGAIAFSANHKYFIYYTINSFQQKLFTIRCLATNKKNSPANFFLKNNFAGQVAVSNNGSYAAAAYNSIINIWKTENSGTKSYDLVQQKKS